MVCVRVGWCVCHVCMFDISSMLNMCCVDIVCWYVLHVCMFVCLVFVVWSIGVAFWYILCVCHVLYCCMCGICGMLNIVCVTGGLVWLSCVVFPVRLVCVVCLCTFVVCFCKCGMVCV